MSMWLIGANTALNSARGRADTEAKRQSAAIVAEGSRQMVRFWTDTLVGSATGRKKWSRNSQPDPIYGNAGSPDGYGGARKSNFNVR